MIFLKSLCLKTIRPVCLSLLLLMPISSFADAITVSTDREKVEIGDIITLTIEADFQTRGQPLNLDKLNQSFEILNKQQSNNIQIINGDFSSTTRWQISLLAKKTGEVTLPIFKINDIESNQLTLSITAAQKKSNTQIGDYSLESELSKQTAYVQEEVLYTLRLYFLGSVSGNIRPPQFNDALSITLKDQSVYGKHIRGQSYTVFEWLYAIYPQKSGELLIPGPLFSGIHQYLNRQKRVQEVANSQTLTVRPEPQIFNKDTGHHWLPASKISLHEVWPSSPNKLKNLHVGDSITRTLTLEATGLLASQLPAFTTQNAQGYKVYPDKAIVEQTKTHTGVQSKLSQKQVFILNQPGTVTIPQETIHWWNTHTQKMETITLAAHNIEVTAPAITKGTTHPKLAVAPSNGKIPITNPSQTVPRETSYLWQFVSLGLGSLLIILTIALMVVRRNLKRQLQQYQMDSNPDITPINPLETNSSTLTSLCIAVKKEANFPLIKLYPLIRAGLAEQHNIKSLQNIPYAPLKQVMQTVEQHLFSQGKLPDDIYNTLCKAINAFLKQEDKRKDSDDKQNQKQRGQSKLNPLYPK